MSSCGPSKRREDHDREGHEDHKGAEAVSASGLAGRLRGLGVKTLSLRVRAASERLHECDAEPPKPCQTRAGT